MAHGQSAGRDGSVGTLGAEAEPRGPGGDSASAGVPPRRRLRPGLDAAQPDGAEPHLAGRGPGAGDAPPARDARPRSGLWPGDQLHLPRPRAGPPGVGHRPLDRGQRELGAGARRRGGAPRLPHPRRGPRPPLRGRVLRRPGQPGRVPLLRHGRPLPGLRRPLRAQRGPAGDRRPRPAPGAERRAPGPPAPVLGAGLLQLPQPPLVARPLAPQRPGHRGDGGHHPGRLAPLADLARGGRAPGLPQQRAGGGDAPRRRRAHPGLHPRGGHQTDLPDQKDSPQPARSPEATPPPSASH